MLGRQKEQAPNGIKKNTVPVKKTIANKTINLKSSPRKSAKAVKSPKKQARAPATPKKNIRGMSLYQFTESARTLRSAATSKKQEVEILETPQRKQQTASKVPMLSRSKRISKKDQQVKASERASLRKARQDDQ